MSDSLVLHELTGSPNSVKVRIALGYKDLSYDRVPASLDGYPGDRSAIARLSRQPRYPVLEHGSIKIFDSRAILRYLESNFPQAPPIFVEDFEAHGEIESWEAFAKDQISQGVGVMFGQAFNPIPDPGEVKRANDLLEQSTEQIEVRLAKQAYLVGNSLTAADIACAAPLYLGDLNESGTDGHPIALAFQKHFKLPATRPRTLAWMRRVVAHDAVMGRAYQAA